MTWFSAINLLDWLIDHESLASYDWHDLPVEIDWALKFRLVQFYQHIANVSELAVHSARLLDHYVNGGVILQQFHFLRFLLSDQWKCIQEITFHTFTRFGS